MKEKKYSSGIVNVIKSYLKKNDWHFSFNEEVGIFSFGLSLSSKLKKINYIIDVNEDEYIVYAIAPIGAAVEDAKMMTAMSEFICRANYGLKNGSFELNMSDGEIRFKCFVDCEGIVPSKDIVENSIHCPAAMFERYGSGIVDIIFGNTTAKEAVEECEKAAEDEFRSLLNELMGGEGEGELGEMLAKLTEQLEALKEADESSDAGCVPAMIKTDLFGTEGDDD